MKNMDHDKEKKIREKMHRFMVDIGGDIMDDEEYELVRKMVQGKFKTISVPYNLLYLRTFFEGVETGIASAQNDMQAPLLAGVARLIAEKEVDVTAKMKKLDSGNSVTPTPENG